MASREQPPGREGLCGRARSPVGCTVRPVPERRQTLQRGCRFVHLDPDRRMRRLRVLLCVALPLAAQTRRPVSSDDYFNFKLVGDPTLSPDGRLVAYRENHNLTRSGEHRDLVESLDWQVYWFTRYLGGKADLGAAGSEVT